MQQMTIITANAKQSRDLGLLKFNPFADGTVEHAAYERGWCELDNAVSWMATLPAIAHPYTEYTVQDAVRLAVANRQMLALQPPANLEEVRTVISAMAECGGHWLTGMAALDVLDAAIDGRDLKQTCRFR